MSGQSGRIVGMIAGAALAYFTGGASYVALGATLGGAVGSLLDPKQKIEGPRLEDLKVQVSTYGIGIPTLYGTERFGGNVIWSTDKLEIPSVTSSGKGGGGTQSTSYKYYVHMRQILCETPRDGSTVDIVKIFQDGKLIWDMSSGIPVGSALASAENLYASFILYQGHQDQLPNAEEEVWQGGPGSVSAYRGAVSIYMRAIECPGGRVPQFSFVLSTSASDAPETTSLTTVPPVQNSVYQGWVGKDGVWHVVDQFNGFGNPNTLNVYYGFNGQVQSSGVFELSTASHPVPYPIVGTENPTFMWARQGVLHSQAAVLFQTIDVQTGVRSEIYAVIGSSAPGYTVGRAAYGKQNGHYALLSYSGSFAPPIIVTGLESFVSCAAVPGSAGLICWIDQILSVISHDGAGVLYHSQRNLDGTSDAAYPATTGPTLSGIDLTKSAIYYGPNGLFAYIIYGAGGAANIYRITPATAFTAGSWELMCVVPGATPANINNSAACTFWCSDEMAVYGPVPATENAYKAVRFHPLTVTEVKAKDIIADQCERAGEFRYDVSALPDSDTVYGYKIAGPASARANIEPILTTFGYYVVDEDRLIKVKRYADITSVATVTFDELGQVEDGSEPGDAMPLNRTQEVDLARSVTVSYIEPTNDFATASETEVRQVTDATEDMQIQLPVAVSSDKAKKVAQMALYDQHRRQNQRSMTVSRKFAAVSPGDGVTVEYPRGTFSLRLVLSTNDTGAVCEWSTVPGDASIFTQTAIGATGYSQQEVASLEPPTRMLLLDAPIMRDADDNAGLYVAAEGYGDGWRGYTLWIGDDDASLQERGTVTTTVPIGFAESALGAWTPNMVDGRNSVVISMGGDVLTSTTSDLLYAGRTNIALIGDHGRWEAIQFQTASSLGGGRYLIYGLMRGLFGTERFNGTHASGDQFVLITQAGMLRPNQEVGGLGQTKSYRAVSLGRSKDGASSISFANEGVGLLPYSPWDARKSKAASNDQTITWQRRSRLSTNAFRGAVPLGESVEAYRIDFYTSSAFTTLAGTLTSTSGTLTITSAQQTSFGLTPGATLFVHISQVSDAVGAGAPLEATL